MIRSSRLSCVVLAAAVVSVFSPAASAVLVPFVEDFATGSANWRDSAGTADLNWFAAGGIDNGSYASTTYNFANAVAGDTPALMRAHASYNSSNGALVGDWLDAGVSAFSFAVRHNAGVPLTFFARIATPMNFPAVAAVAFAPVQSDVWTTITFTIEPDNPAFVFEGPPAFSTIFSNVGNIQIGVMVPDQLAGVDQTFSFDIDRVTLVPAPGVAGMLLLASFGFTRTRRRRC